MHIDDLKKLQEIANIQTHNAEAYAEARRLAGEAESDIKILLTSKLKELRLNKKNIGVEMAILMLMEDSEVAKVLYKQWMHNEAIYKGLEKLLEATAAKLIFSQSIMKFQKDGERWS